MKRMFVGLLLSGFVLFSCSKSPNNPVDRSDPGSANITVKVGKVGVLGKIRNIELSKLYISLTAPDETPIYDTIDLSGNGQQTISKTYSGLASLLKTWTLHAESRDVQNTIIHSGDTSFIVRPRQDIPISLTLDAKYSMLKANFFPIRDSVTRCELLVDGNKVDDSSFDKQALLGDTVRLSYNYLTTGVSQRIKLDVYGIMWGFDTLLYTGDTTITPLPGMNASYTVTLRWVSPHPPVGGATMTVVLGAVGTVVINGTMQKIQWVEKSPMPVIRTGFTYATINDQIYICGGDSNFSAQSFSTTNLQRYSPSTNTWETDVNHGGSLTTMPLARSFYQPAGVIHGRAHVCGGWENGSYRGDHMIYDPVANAWTTGPALPQYPIGQTAVAVNDALYVFGGWWGSYQNTTLVYTDESGWSYGASMPTARAHAAAGVCNGKIYCIGGADGAGASINPLNIVEMFDPIANTWSSGLAPMPVAECYLGSAGTPVLDGKIYILGPGTAAFRYDVAANSWETLENMPGSAYGIVALNGKVYAIGPEHTYEGTPVN